MLPGSRQPWYKMSNFITEQVAFVLTVRSEHKRQLNYDVLYHMCLWLSNKFPQWPHSIIESVLQQDIGNGIADNNYI